MRVFSADNRFFGVAWNPKIKRLTVGLWAWRLVLLEGISDLSYRKRD